MSIQLKVITYVLSAYSRKSILWHYGKQKITEVQNFSTLFLYSWAMQLTNDIRSNFFVMELLLISHSMWLYKHYLMDLMVPFFFSVHFQFLKFWHSSKLLEYEGFQLLDFS